MKTFNRICIKNYEIHDSDGATFSLERGKEYRTSAVNHAPSIVGPEAKEGHVVVFSNYWVSVPVDIFAGEIEC